MIRHQHLALSLRRRLVQQPLTVCVCVCIDGRRDDESILLLLCLHRRSRHAPVSARANSRATPASYLQPRLIGLVSDRRKASGKERKREGGYRNDVGRNGLSVWKHANQNCLASLWRRKESTNREIEQGRGKTCASILRPSLLIRRQRARSGPEKRER